MKPFIPLLQPLYDLGIDPKTGLPLKMENNVSNLEMGMRMILNRLDSTQTITRFKYKNLPKGLSGDIIERTIYYRGKCCIFYEKTSERFYALPCTMGKGGLDEYGRYRTAKPVLYQGGTFEDPDQDYEFINNLDLNVIYELPEEQEIDIKMFDNSCVIVYDHTRELNANNNIARAIEVQPLILAESEAYPFARTNIISNSGVRAFRVTDSSEAPRVDELGRKVTDSAKRGLPFLGVQGNLEFQDLTDGGSPMKSEEYLLYLQSLDNFRQGTIGVGDGAIFEKKAHMLNREAGMNGMCPGQILSDALNQRVEAFNILNAIYDQEIEIELSEDLVPKLEEQEGFENNQDSISGSDNGSDNGSEGENYDTDD